MHQWDRMTYEKNYYTNFSHGWVYDIEKKMK